MILPIVAYGDPILKKKAKDIDKDFPGLEDLIGNMWESMYNANGVGLAAPQVGMPLRLFIVDPSPFAEDKELSEKERESLKDFKKTFINPKMLKEIGDEWAFNEGCLSIPDIREDIFRKPEINIEYFDENFNKHVETYTGIAARVIQHEYDHIEGILFTDKLSGLKKRLIKRKLENISKGNVSIDYRMRFPKLKKTR